MLLKDTSPYAAADARQYKENGHQEQLDLHATHK